MREKEIKIIRVKPTLVNVSNKILPSGKQCMVMMRDRTLTFIFRRIPQDAYD